MNRYTITDAANSFRRVTKREAVKLLNSGKQVALCPCKLRPGFPFAPHVTIDKAHLDAEDCSFESYINNFNYYNCTCNETGLYPAFYEVTPK